MSLRKSFATGIGGLLSVFGLILSASFIGWRGRDPGITLVTGTYPDWAIFGFLGGFVFVIGGAAIGLRYGNLQRYHDDYNPETGRIEGHWFGRFTDRVTTDEYGSTDAAAAPDKFDPNITFGELFVELTAVMSPLIGYLGYEVWSSQYLDWGFFALTLGVLLASIGVGAYVGVQADETQ